MRHQDELLAVTLHDNHIRDLRENSAQDLADGAAKSEF